MSMTYNVRQAGAVTVVDLGGRIGPREPTASGPGSGMALHELVRDLVEHGYKKILLNFRDVNLPRQLGYRPTVRFLYHRAKSRRSPEDCLPTRRRA